MKSISSAYKDIITMGLSKSKYLKTENFPTRKKVEHTEGAAERIELQIAKLDYEQII